MIATFSFTYSLCFDYIDLAPIVLVLNGPSDVSLSMLAFLNIFLIGRGPPRFESWWVTTDDSLTLMVYSPQICLTKVRFLLKLSLAWARFSFMFESLLCALVLSYESCVRLHVNSNKAWWADTWIFWYQYHLMIIQFKKRTPRSTVYIIVIRRLQERDSEFFKIANENVIEEWKSNLLE